MQVKDAAILLRKEKEMLVFLGPGGYKIEWSPRAKRLPMTPAPSGHLVIKCDRLAEANRNSSQEPQISFCTGRINE